MLKIIANDELLELGNAKLSFTHENPFFDSHNIGRSYSLPFDIPKTPNNLSVLGYADRLDSPTPRSYYDSEIIISEIIRLKGRLFVSQLKKDSINVYWNNDALTHKKEDFDVLISELDYPTVNVNSPRQLYIFKHVQEKSDNITVSFKLKGKNYNIQGGTLTDIPGTSIKRSDVLSKIAKAINADYFGTAVTDQVSTSIGPEVVVTSWLIVHAPSYPDMNFVLEDLQYISSSASEVGTGEFDILQSFDPATALPSLPANTPLKKTIGWNGSSIAQQSETFIKNQVSKPFENVDFVFAPLKNPDFYGDENNEYCGYVNFWPVGDTNKDPDKYNFSPFVKLRAVLGAIEKRFSVRFDEFFSDDKGFSRLVFYNNNCLDENFKEIIPPFDTTDNGQPFVASKTFKHEVLLNEYLPELSVNDLLRSLSNLFCCCFYFQDNGSVDVKLRKDILQTSEEDWTTYTEPEYRYKWENTKGFSLDFKLDKDDIKQKGNNVFEGVYSGEKKLKFQSEISAPFSENSIYNSPSLSREWLTASVKQEGKSKTVDLDGDATPKLMIYHGMQKDSKGNTYPLVTNGNLDFDKNVIGNWSLLWKGENGLYNTFWKDVITFLQNAKAVTNTVRLSPSQINDLLNWKKPKKKIYRPEGTVTGIVKSIRFSVSVDGFSPCQVELLT